MKYFLILFLLVVGCGKSWTWKADPYEFDVDKQLITNGVEEVAFDDPCIIEFTAFPIENIIALKQEIEKFKISQEQKEMVQSQFDFLLQKKRQNAFPKRNY